MTVPAVIRLRSLCPADAPALLAFRLRNRRHLHDSEPLRAEEWFTLEGQLRHLTEMEAAQRQGTEMTFGVFAGEALVGRVAVTGIVRGAFLSGYLGYAVDHAHVGRGIGSAAVAATARHAFDAGLHRLQAAVVPTNRASLRLLAKVGFTHEGIARKYLRLAGRWQDHELWAMIDSDEILITEAAPPPR